MQPYNKHLKLQSPCLRNNVADAEKRVWSRFGENKNMLNI